MIASWNNTILALVHIWTNIRYITNLCLGGSHNLLSKKLSSSPWNWAAISYRNDLKVAQVPKIWTPWKLTWQKNSTIFFQLASFGGRRSFRSFSDGISTRRSPARNIFNPGEEAKAILGRWLQTIWLMCDAYSLSSIKLGGAASRITSTNSCGTNAASWSSFNNWRACPLSCYC